MNQFRVARHTAQLDAIIRFYIDILGLKKLGEFDHEGYKGVFIGEENQSWHLEFTQNEIAPCHKADEDHLLVFYMDNEQLYKACIARIEKTGYTKVTAQNPYWNVWGKTYLDPDGFRVVICNKKWSNS